jgi:hypothetical protein
MEPESLPCAGGHTQYAGKCRYRWRRRDWRNCWNEPPVPLLQLCSRCGAGNYTGSGFSAAEWRFVATFLITSMGGANQTDSGSVWSPEAEVALIRKTRLQCFDDWAIRYIISRATGGQSFQRALHLFEICDLCSYMEQMNIGNALHPFTRHLLAINK